MLALVSQDRQKENEISREQVCWEALYDHLKERSRGLADD